MSNQLTALWDSWATTPEAHTKRVNTGGRTFHAIDPYYRFRRATEAWGPCGTGWGWDHRYEVVDTGVPAADGGPNQILIVAHVGLWYGPESERGHVHATGAAWLVQRTKRGAMTDDEAYKKALTDGLTKALSYLGCGADVFLGKHDDSKYIAELREAEKAQAPAPPPAEPDNLDERADQETVAKMVTAFQALDAEFTREKMCHFLGVKTLAQITNRHVLDLRKTYAELAQEARDRAEADAAHDAAPETREDADNDAS